MGRTIRHSKRERQKTKRRKKRRQARKNGNGKKAGSIAITSCLPGLEGTEIGAMDVIVDARRNEIHEAEINVSIHQRAEKRSIAWTVETGFGGQSPRVGYRVIPDGSHNELDAVTWVHEISGDSKNHNAATDDMETI